MARDAGGTRSGRLEVAVAQARGHLRFRSPGNDRQEKPGPDKPSARTKTDTGRRDEDSQALERTLVKELGKLTP